MAHNYKVTCEATTKKGTPCSIEASPGSIFCHVHNPDLQCGATKRNGQRCNVATGGGPCKYHTPGAQKPPRRRRRPRFTPEERAQRRAERKRQQRDALAELDRIAEA